MIHKIFAIPASILLLSLLSSEKPDVKSVDQVVLDDVVISADAMNVLYIGIDNPLSIAVPDMSSDDIVASISGVDGSIIKNSGSRYTVKVRQTGSAIIKVMLKLSDGSTSDLGQKKFKVRRLPKPEARWGAISNNGLPVPKNAVLAQRTLFASLGEGFAFDGVVYNVVSYQFVFDPMPPDSAFVKRVYGSLIDNQVKNIIRESNPGDRIWIDMIRANGPSGTRNLSPISFIIE